MARMNEWNMSRTCDLFCLRKARRELQASTGYENYNFTFFSTNCARMPSTAFCTAVFTGTLFPF